MSAAVLCLFGMVGNPVAILPLSICVAATILLLRPEVRAVTGGDEMFIGMSPEYNKSPNDLVYKTLLLSRCVTRIGSKSLITVGDVQRLHARDVRALEYAIYRLTYGEEAIQEPDGPSG